MRKQKIPFKLWWDAYNKKIGWAKCEKKWNDLTIANQHLAMEHTPIYVLSTPEKQYRKNPYTYLHNESWNDEIIQKEKTGDSSTAGTSRLEEIAKGILRRDRPE